MLFNPAIVWIRAKLESRISPEVGYIFNVISSSRESSVEQSIFSHIEVVFNEDTDFSLRITVGAEQHESRIARDAASAFE